MHNFWPNGMGSFWPKMILAYFCRGFRLFCAQVSVVYFWILETVIIQFCKMPFLEQWWISVFFQQHSFREELFQNVFWGTTKHTKIGVLRDLWAFCLHQDTTLQKRLLIEKWRSLRLSFWAYFVLFLQDCWYAYFYSVFPVLVFKELSERSETVFWEIMHVSVLPFFVFVFLSFLWVGLWKV